MHDQQAVLAPNSATCCHLELSLCSPSVSPYRSHIPQSMMCQAQTLTDTLSRERLLRGLEIPCRLCQRAYAYLERTHLKSTPSYPNRVFEPSLEIKSLLQ